jgi:hypothetical protein
MLKSSGWSSAYVAVLSVTAAAGLLWWLVSASDADTFWRDQFPPEVALGGTVCQESVRGGPLEESSIAVFAVDSNLVERLAQYGPSFLNRETPAPNSRGWLWTPWIQVGSGDDMLRPEEDAVSEKPASRARMFVFRADDFTHNRCLSTIEGLDWSGAMVRFEHPVSWSVEMCGDSCLAQILLPASRLAIVATYD